MGETRRLSKDASRRATDLSGNVTDPWGRVDPTIPSLTPLESGPPILEARVLSELLAARKAPDGLTEGLMARLPTLHALLGDSDPQLALRHLMRSIAEHAAQTDDALAVAAAAYSLGLAEEVGQHHNTHLARLEAFGERFGFEQRQARRYSDRGLRELTRLITTSWVTHATPRLDLIVVGLSPSSCAVLIDTAAPTTTPMRQPSMGISRDDEPEQQAALSFVAHGGDDPNEDDDDRWTRQRLERPLRIDLGRTTRLVARWAPLWAQFSVALTEQERMGGVDVVIEMTPATVGVVVQTVGRGSTAPVEEMRE